MEIAPNDDTLVAHVQFSTGDRDTVHAGMPAEITFPAFHSRRIRAIIGNLETVPHDRLIDETIHRPFLETMQGRLRAGMPAEAVITTDGHTALDAMVAAFFEAKECCSNEH